MRWRQVIALLFVVVCVSVALANARQWKDAKVIRIASSTENNGVVVGTTGTTAVGDMTKSTSMYYWIETEDMTYVLDYSYNPAVKLPWPGQHSRGRTPNLTVNGKTKISIDGRNAHILDDDGRDVKIPIFEKIARTPEDTKK
jgi:hypothetical protein